jgi:hypothetical protein
MNQPPPEAASPTGAHSPVGDAERQPLLICGSRRRGGRDVRSRLTAELDREWADCVLLLCYMITGLLDASSISIWGSFVSMQTGKCGRARRAWNHLATLR